MSVSAALYKLSLVSELKRITHSKCCGSWCIYFLGFNLGTLVRYDLTIDPLVLGGSSNCHVSYWIQVLANWLDIYVHEPLCL